MSNKPSKDEYAKFKALASDKSKPESFRKKFQNIVDKFAKDFEEVGGETEKEVKKVEKVVKKVVKKAVSTTKKALTKADILKKVGKTEKECEDILEQYKSLRSKATTRKKAETKAKDDNKKRVTKLKAEDKVIKGTTEKKATSTLETTATKIEDKVEKEIKKIEDDATKKVESEIKPIVEKQVAKDKTKTPTQQKAEVKKIVEVKVKEAVKKEVKKEGKKIVAKLEVDTKDIITSITTALGNHDKDLQKEFLIKLRSDIDKLLKKFMYGGLTDGASSVQNITQSQMSSSSVNFDKGGSTYAEGGLVNVVVQEKEGVPYKIIAEDVSYEEAKKIMDDYKKSGKPFRYIETDNLPFSKGGSTYAEGGVLTKAELKLNIYEPSGDYYMEKKGGKIILHLTSKDASNLPPSFFERYNVEDNGKGYYGTSYIVSKKTTYALGGMTDRGYNGWTNYATWRVNLEMVDGVEWDEYNDGEPITNELLESYVEEGLENYPELAISYANAFLNDVNYHEIAKHINEDYGLSDEDEFAKGGSMASGGEIMYLLKNYGYKGNRGDKIIVDSIDKKLGVVFGSPKDKSKMRDFQKTETFEYEISDISSITPNPKSNDGSTYAEGGNVVVYGKTKVINELRRSPLTKKGGNSHISSDGSEWQSFRFDTNKEKNQFISHLNDKDIKFEDKSSTYAEGGSMARGGGVDDKYEKFKQNLITRIQEDINKSKERADALKQSGNKEALSFENGYNNAHNTTLFDINELDYDYHNKYAKGGMTDKGKAWHVTGSVTNQDGDTFYINDKFKGSAFKDEDDAVEKSITIFERSGSGNVTESDLGADYIDLRYSKGGMTDRGYNGWTNYATWRVNLEMVDGVEWDEYNDGEPITKDLLESYVEEGLENYPELAISYANAFLNDVNYYEIAKHINEDYSLSDEDEFAKGGSMATGGKISKDDAIIKALKMGVDFDKDFHAQSFGNELSELAKESGYRKSRSASGSLGRAFFEHLERIYDKNKSYYKDMANDKYALGGEIIDTFTSIQGSKVMPNNPFTIEKENEFYVIKNSKGEVLAKDTTKDGIMNDKGMFLNLYAKGGSMASGGEIKMGDFVANKVHKTVGEVIDVFDRNDFRTDADGVVNGDDLEIYSKTKHKGYQIAPSTQDKMGGSMASGGEIKNTFAVEKDGKYYDYYDEKWYDYYDEQSLFDEDWAKELAESKGGNVINTDTFAKGGSMSSGGGIGRKEWEKQVIKEIPKNSDYDLVDAENIIGGYPDYFEFLSYWQDGKTPKETAIIVLDKLGGSTYALGGGVKPNIAYIDAIGSFGTNDDSWELVTNILKKHNIEVDNSKDWHTKGYAEELYEERDGTPIITIKLNMNDAPNPKKLKKEISNLPSRINYEFTNDYAKGGKLWLDTGKKGGTKGVKKSNRGSFRAKADARGLTSKQLAQKVIANPKRYKGIKEQSAHLVNAMVKRHGGGIMNADNQFTKKANQRGVSVEAFMQRVLSNPSKYDATTIKQARTLKNNS